jgi:hypothetical protein
MRRDLNRQLGQFPVFDGAEIGLVGEPSGVIAGYFLRRNHEASTASHASPMPPITVDDIRKQERREEEKTN